jgi:hypothetical protein
MCSALTLHVGVCRTEARKDWYERSPLRLRAAAIGVDLLSTQALDEIAWQAEEVMR